MTNIEIRCAMTASVMQSIAYVIFRSSCLRTYINQRYHKIKQVKNIRHRLSFLSFMTEDCRSTNKVDTLSIHEHICKFKIF